MRRTAKTIAATVKSRCTRKNAAWFARSCGWSWCIQGGLFVALSACGLGAAASVVTAKAASYVCWFGQLWRQARGD
jgi:hypothetical protein